MKQATEKLLDEMQFYPWFSRQGIDKSAYTMVTSFAAAIKSLNTLKWNQLDTALMNQHLKFVDANMDRRSEQYIRLSAEIRDRSYALAERIIANNDDKYRPILREIKGVICGAAFECEYADIAPSYWYIPKIIPVYQLGHIVCGWDGPKVDNTWKGNSFLDLPTGKLKVY